MSAEGEAVVPRRRNSWVMYLCGLILASSTAVCAVYALFVLAGAVVGCVHVIRHIEPVALVPEMQCPQESSREHVVLRNVVAPANAFELEHGYYMRAIAAGLWLPGCVHTVVFPGGARYHPVYLADLNISVVIGMVTEAGVQFAGIDEIYGPDLPLMLAMPMDPDYTLKLVSFSNL